MFKHLLFLAFLAFYFTSSIAQTNRNLEQKAEKFFQEEKYKEVRPILKALQSNYLREENYSNYVKISTQLAISLQKLDDYSATLPILQKAIEISQGKSLPDSILAPAYHKLGVAHFFGQKDTEAILNWKKAIELRQKFLPQNHFFIIKGYRNIGQSYIFLKNWANAKSNLKHCIHLQLNTEFKDTIYLAETFIELGDVFTNIEDFNQAEKHLEQALNLYQSIYGNNELEYDYLYENFFLLYQKSNHPEKMIKYTKKVIDLYEFLEDKDKSDYEILALNYNNLSIGYDLKNDLRNAIYASDKALDYMKKSGKEAAEIFTNQSFLYRKKESLTLALNSIEKAIIIDSISENTIGEAESLNSKAVILGSMGKEESALNVINKAISKISNKNHIFDKPLYVVMLNDKAKILKSLSRQSNDIEYLKKASAVYDNLLVVLNNIRTGYISDESKSFLANKSKEILKDAIDLNLQLYKTTKTSKYLNQAFHLAEQAKSIILMDALQQAQVRQTTDVPSELLNKEKELQKQIATKEKALFLGEEEATKLNNDLISLNQQLEKLTDTLKQNYPKYHEAKYATALPSINDIQNIIDNNLIEYFVGDSTIYVFKITKDQANIDYIEIPIDFPLADWIKQLREGIYQPHLQKLRSDEEEVKYAQDLVDIAHQLYAKLIAPIITPSKKVEKLVIIPDGILGYIPFDVLITSPPEDATLFGAHDYLIKDFQISYAYSATSLLEMQKKEFSEVASSNFTAFAPTFEGTQEVGFVRSIANLRGDLSPLEFNIPEVTAIQKLIGGSLYTGLDATRSNFIQNAAHSKIVHLATHGKANDEKGDYAFLAFTDTKDSIDYKLYNRDLYNLALNADMVVLSACETGIGELQKGEGIISLARGFTYAGAKSIVTTLWSINDNRTKEIMERFYGYLKKGQTKDNALRQAKLDFIENYGHNAHPFFWAAFIPIGDMEVIEFSNDWGWKFGLIGLVGLVLFFFWKRNRV